MIIRMYNRIIEDLHSAMCGVFGFGVTWTNLHLGDVLTKFTISMITAALAGGMGYVGKLVTAWAVRRIKSFLSSLKRKNGNRNNV